MHLGDLVGHRHRLFLELSSGTTLLTMPSFSASAAVIELAVNSSSFALRGPNSQVWP